MKPVKINGELQKVRNVKNKKKTVVKENRV